MINKNKIKIVLFDIDNTLYYGKEARKFYSKYSRCLESTLARELKISIEEAKSIADDYRQKYNGHGEKSFEAFGIDKSIWYEAILSLNPQQYLVPLHYSNKLLKILRELGFTIGAITDGPRIQASKILKAIQIEENSFDFIIAWEEGGQMPKYGSTKIYKEICERYAIRPSEAVMIGDSLESDILPAKETGLDVIYINDSNNNQYKTIKSIEELYKSLKKQNIIN